MKNVFIYINKVGLKTLLCFLCKIVYNSVGETFEYRFHVVRLLKYQFVWYVLQNFLCHIQLTPK